MKRDGIFLLKFGYFSFIYSKIMLYFRSVRVSYRRRVEPERIRQTGGVIDV